MFVVLLTFGGGIVGYIWPGMITGLFLPVGLTLWWLLYKYITKRADIAELRAALPGDTDDL